MKIAFAVLCFCSFVFSQSLAPAPKSPEPNEGVKFEMYTDYMRLTDGANATVLGARLPITPRYSVVYSQYQIPSAHAQLYLIGPEFREKVSHFFKPSSVQINLDKIEVFARVDLGTKRDDQGNNPTFAWGIHGGADFPIGKVGGGVLNIGVKFGLIGVPRQPVGPRIFKLGSTAEIAPGVSLRF